MITLQCYFEAREKPQTFLWWIQENSLLFLAYTQLFANSDEFQWILWKSVFWKWALVDFQDAPELHPVLGAILNNPWDPPKPTTRAKPNFITHIYTWIFVNSVNINCEWNLKNIIKLLCILQSFCLQFPLRSITIEKNEIQPPEIQ